MRFETGPAEQSQVDWSSTAVFLGKERVWIHIFTMVLGYSRRIFARAYRSEGMDALLDGHEKAFAHLGGRTETILYDNPRTIVTEKNEETGEVVWNRTFADRMDFYGVKVRLCPDGCENVSKCGANKTARNSKMAGKAGRAKSAKNLGKREG